MTAIFEATGRVLSRGLAPVLLAALLLSPPAAAFDPNTLDSVVSVLPRWPGYRQGGTPAVPPGRAPEGSAVAVKPGGYLVTALHVVDRATAIDVRLPDGRLRPAELAGADAATDLALLKVDAALPVLATGGEPALGTPVCALGNQFGLGLSVTCGVVSAVRRSGTGFNPIEDFIQTDAVVNPGASGGALVDREGRLVGVLSAIFTKDSDADIGVNFATSTALVLRVVEDLLAHGRVIRARPGFRAVDLTRRERADSVGARVARVAVGGGAEQAGLRAGDLLTRIAGRHIGRASDVAAAIHLHRPGDSLDLEVQRDGTPLTLRLTLEE